MPKFFFINYLWFTTRTYFLQRQKQVFSTIIGQNNRKRVKFKYVKLLLL